MSILTSVNKNLLPLLGYKFDNTEGYEYVVIKIIVRYDLFI